MTGTMQLSKGSPSLTPGMTQLAVSFNLAVNGVPPSFEQCENLTRSFAQGQFYKSWSERNHEQTIDGFRATFINQDKDDCELRNQSRRQVRSVDIDVDLTHQGVDLVTVFEEILSLCDYGFCLAITTFETVAPAVFSVRYRPALRLKPLAEPIQRALNITGKSDNLQYIAELGLSSGSKRDASQTSAEWRGVGFYFEALEYRRRQFIVLDRETAAENIHMTCLPSSTTAYSDRSGDSTFVDDP